MLYFNKRTTNVSKLTRGTIVHSLMYISKQFDEIQYNLLIQHNIYYLLFVLSNESIEVYHRYLSDV